jgi:hypothetical protein
MLRTIQGLALDDAAIIVSPAALAVTGNHLAVDEKLFNECHVMTSPG